jgi:pentatricopeptide repeat protein
MYRLVVKRVWHAGRAVKRPLGPASACNAAQPAPSRDSPKHVRSFHSSAPVLKRHGGASAHEPKYLWRRRKKSKINAKRGLRKKQHGEPNARAKAERAERAQAGVSSNALALTYDEAAEDEKFAGFMEELMAPIAPAAKPVTAMESYRDIDADQFWSYARKLAAAPTTPPEQLWRTYAKLIRVLSMQRRYKEAKLIVLREMLEAGVQPNANIYCALLLGAQHARDSSAIDDLWRHMKANGVSPTPDVWHTLLLALRAVGRVDDALAAGAAMQKAGHPWDQKVYFCILDMLVKARRHKEAWDVSHTHCVQYTCIINSVACAKLCNCIVS